MSQPRLVSPFAQACTEAVTSVVRVMFWRASKAWMRKLAASEGCRSPRSAMRWLLVVPMAKAQGWPSGSLLSG